MGFAGSLCRLPTPVSVIVSAAAFALAHLTPGEFPQLFVLGKHFKIYLVPIILASEPNFCPWKIRKIISSMEVPTPVRLWLRWWSAGGGGVFCSYAKESKWESLHVGKSSDWCPNLVLGTWKHLNLAQLCVDHLEYIYMSFMQVFRLYFHLSERGKKFEKKNAGLRRHDSCR